MSHTPGDGSDASTPWERPQPPAPLEQDSTSVDDLIARLGSGGVTGRQRHRRTDGAPEVAVPASELIAALQQPTEQAPNPAERAPLPSASTPVDEGTTTDSRARPDDESGADLGADEPNDAITEDDRDSTDAGGGTAPEFAVAEAPDAEVPDTDGPDLGADEPNDAITDDDRDSIDTGGAAAPKLTNAEGPDTEDPATEGPAADDQHTLLISAVTATVAPDPQWDAIRASLRRHAGLDDVPSGAPATQAHLSGSSTGSGQTSSSSAALQEAHAGTPAPRALGRRRAALVAGRSVIAVVSAVVLLLTGLEWTITQRADAGLADRQVSALAPDDTNISTAGPVTVMTTDSAGAQIIATPTGPAPTYPPENILLMGSDTRAGTENAALGGTGPGSSDTMQSDVLMIAHISADRSKLTVLSIPRDLYVPAPTCKAWDYQKNTLSDQTYVDSHSEWKITNAFSVGGPQCTVRAVQKLTGLQITRVIIIDFEGFKTMVDALGGVTLNICAPIIDGELGTVAASAGVQTLQGGQALQLVRARKVKGDDTGDLGRIRRQQVLLSAILRQVTSAGLLLNPARLNSFLQAFVNSTQTDNVTLDDLINLAHSMGNLDPARVDFYTLPTEPNGEGESITSASRAIFAALLNDQPLPDRSAATPAATDSTSTAIGTSTSASPVPTSPTVLTVRPTSIDLQVVNVAGTAGVAGRAMTALNAVGFAITDNDLLLLDEVQTGITVRYSPGNEAAALTVAAAVPGSNLQQTAGLGKRVQLMLGSDFDGTVRAVSVGDTAYSRTTETTPAQRTERGTTTRQSPTSTGTAGSAAPVTAAVNAGAAQCA